MLLLCALSVSAQNGFSLSGDYGIGLSYERKLTTLDYHDYYGKPWTFQSVICKNANFNISYTHGHWQFRTGIGYAVNGYTRSDKGETYYNISSMGILQNGSIGLTTIPARSEKFYYPLISIPLLVGYHISLSTKVSLTPHAGLSVTNNIKSHFRVKQDTTEYTFKIVNSDFDKGYKRTGWWASASLDVAYHITSRWDIFAGPHFDYMLTNMVKNEYWSYEDCPLKLYKWTISVGVTWKVSGKK